METDMETSADIALRQTEALRGEIRHSRTRMLIALLAATYIAFWWLGALVWKWDLILPLRLFAGLPILLNASSWVARFLFSGSFLSMGHLDAEPYELSSYQDLYAAAFRDYSLAQRTLHRQKKIERLVDLLISVQFICMGLLLFLYITSVRW